MAPNFEPNLVWVLCVIALILSCGCTDKNVHVLYNPDFSQKGVMGCVKKHPKRERHEDFVAIQYAHLYWKKISLIRNIQTPHSLPMFKQQKSTRRAREKAKSDPTRAAIPVAPQIGPGTGFQHNWSFYLIIGGRLGSSLTASIMKGLVQKTNIDNDPRAALLKYHDERGIFVLKLSSHNRIEGDVRRVQENSTRSNLSARRARWWGWQVVWIESLIWMLFYERIYFSCGI